MQAITAVSTIAGTARGEIAGGQGAVFAIYLLAYCFLYFRMYPRPAAPPETKKAPEPAKTPPPAIPPRPAPPAL